jgi:hypothetical protein
MLVEILDGLLRSEYSYNQSGHTSVRIRAQSAVLFAAMVAMSGPAYSGSPARQLILTYQFSPCTGPVTVTAGAPYSGDRVTEAFYKLSNGLTLHAVAEQGRLYRDSRGRTRSEEPVGKPEDQSAPLVRIFDPQSRAEYILDPQRQVAHRLSCEVAAEPMVGKPQGEALGARWIEGLLADGVRLWTTYNNGPLPVGEERWTARELGTVVLQKIQDPRAGETIRRLAHVSRQEPDASLFRVPPGYLVVEESGPFSLRISVSQGTVRANRTDLPWPFQAFSLPAMNR